MPNNFALIFAASAAPNCCTRGRPSSTSAKFAYLRDFLKRKGRITARMIPDDIDLPCPQIYSSRFGGLKPAYEMIGYKTTRKLEYVERDRALKPTRWGFTKFVIDEFRRMGISVVQNSRTKLLILNGKLALRRNLTKCPIGGGFRISPCPANSTVRRSGRQCRFLRRGITETRPRAVLPRSRLRLRSHRSP